jgi:hypothetical protein
VGTVVAIDGRPIGAPKADRRQASRCTEDRSARFPLAGVNESGKREKAECIEGSYCAKSGRGRS